MKGLWIDDIRPLPSDLNEDQWDIARTGWEALYLLDTKEYDVVSFDHDLASFVGNKEINGYDILVWLASRRVELKYVPKDIRVHTANPVGREKMLNVIEQFLSGD